MDAVKLDSECNHQGRIHVSASSSCPLPLFLHLQSGGPGCGLPHCDKAGKRSALSVAGERCFSGKIGVGAPRVSNPPGTSANSEVPWDSGGCGPWDDPKF